MRPLLSLLFISLPVFLFGQFAPRVGEPGSTAISKDSLIIGWGLNAEFEIGYQQINDTSLGLATVGNENSPVGVADGNSLSLGDGGWAIIEVDLPITNQPGFDFVVFENSFSDYFLELAFVEVSSDGQSFWRFPATSLTQDSVQVGGFDSLEATNIDNLAGKYRGGYGTPFDLEVFAPLSALNTNRITHIRIIDVVGSIDSNFANYDQHGTAINDPWPTPFPSSGFDLDAIGVLHSNDYVQNIEAFGGEISDNTLVYPNPADQYALLPPLASKVSVTSTDGRQHRTLNNKLNTSNWAEGFYIIQYELQGQTYYSKLCVRHE